MSRSGSTVVGLDVLQEAGDELYAVIDACRARPVIGWLLRSGVDVHCLFDGIQAVTLARVAPYCVNIGATRSLLPELLDQVWGRSAAIFIRSNAGIQQVRLHLRSLLWTRVENKTALLRYYDPRALSSLLRSATFEQLQTLFSDKLTSIFLESQTAASLIEVVLQPRKGIANLISPVDITAIEHSV